MCKALLFFGLDRTLIFMENKKYFSKEIKVLRFATLFWQIGPFFKSEGTRQKNLSILMWIFGLKSGTLN